MSASNPVPRIYRAVIDDVIKNVKESFLNESVDEQVLAELKRLWESKLLQSRAIDFMPSDVNVRVSLTYPHTMPQMQGINQQAGSSSNQHRESPNTHSAPQIIQNQDGQLMYVSSHPTLGNVGQMSNAASQAAFAMQNTPRNASAQSLPASIQPGHVVHVRGAPTATNNGQHPNMFPSFVAGNRGIPAGARVIYAHQQPQQQHTGPPPHKKQVIQVDGASHEEEERFSAEDKHKGDIILQIDGNDSTSEEDFDEDEDFDNYPVAPITGSSTDGKNPIEEEEEPLNSEDDVSDEDPTDLFDTDNVVVCQYDKIARTRNRWKFHLKDGIMNLRSKDYVFHKANGDSEW